MKYTILMNGHNFTRNKFNTLAECKERIFTAKNIFRSSKFFVVVNALRHLPG